MNAPCQNHGKPQGVPPIVHHIVVNKLLVERQKTNPSLTLGELQAEIRASAQEVVDALQADTRRRQAQARHDAANLAGKGQD